MREHLGRQAGVAKVDVELASGKVAIYPKTDGTIDPERILKATYDSGVTPAEMTITASGHIVKDPQRGLLFQVAANQSFEIAPTENAKRLEGLAGTGTEVTLRGRLYKKPAGKQKSPIAGPLRLEILEVLKKE